MAQAAFRDGRTSPITAVPSTDVEAQRRTTVNEIFPQDSSPLLGWRADDTQGFGAFPGTRTPHHHRRWSSPVRHFWRVVWFLECSACHCASTLVPLESVKSGHPKTRPVFVSVQDSSHLPAPHHHQPQPPHQKPRHARLLPQRQRYCGGRQHPRLAIQSRGDFLLQG